MIEYLTEETLEEALDFAEKSHVHSRWSDYHFERDFLRQNMKERIGKSQYFLCMYRVNGEIVGYFLGAPGRFLFSRRLLGLETGIFVAPEHRGGRAIIEMFRAYKVWCDSLNAEPLVEIYFGDDSENEKVYSLFRKLGMIECGRAFRGGANGMRDRSQRHS